MSRRNSGTTVGQHLCAWPECDKLVPHSMWGCREHWSMLPASLRSRVWSAYLRGTENYSQVAEEVQQWIATRHGAE